MIDDSKPVVLVGFMGSGKSTVGPILARLLDREFVDLDSRIEAGDGRTVERIFAEGGEAEFRRLEHAALQALGGSPGVVAAAGGGVFSEFRSRLWLRRHAVTCWLDVTLAEAETRVGHGAGRPLWFRGDDTAFRAFFEKRRLGYGLAALRVAAGGADPEGVAQRLLHALRGAPGSERAGPRVDFL